MTDSITQKKVIKRKRLNVKRASIFALSIIVISILIWFLFTLKTESVIVSGNSYVNDSEIIKKSKVLEKKYLLLSNRNVCKNVKKNIFIDTCEIKKSWLLKVEIVVSENKPLFFYKENDKTALSNGIFTEQKNIYGVPTLINYVPKKILNKFISGLKDINSDIIQSISEIEYTPSQNSDGEYIDEERFMLSMNDGNIVYINIRNLNVLNKYEKIYASIGSKKGYFNFDADFGNYYFKEFGSEE